jgi:predicted Rdx family selenoprotein
VQPGEHSEFTVFADDRLLFSKQAEGRFPQPDEIIERLRH